MTSRERGYSLVELMAAMVITLFVMAGVYTLMLQNQRTYEQQSQLADAQQAARVAIDLMTREIRMAGADPGGRAFAPLAVCTTGTYKPPTTPEEPIPGDLAAITIAKASQIRVKMDRAVWTLGADPVTTPTPVISPAPKEDKTSDGDYFEDDEDQLGDGFLNDEAEDLEFLWDAATQTLFRTEYKSDPATACRYSGAPAAPAASTLALADRVVSLDFKYYSDEPTNAACPTGVYATQVLYEAARDICDPPLAFDNPSSDQPGDLTRIRRVRIVLVVETERVDPIDTRAGRSRMTFTSQATLRNRR